MRRLVLSGIGLAVLVAVLTAANLGREGGGYRLDWDLLQTPPREVELASPARAEIIETISAAGTVEPVEEAEIAPQVVGRVVEVFVEDGDRVAKGDLLVQLDPTAARASLDSVEARIERLRALIVDAEEDVEKAARDLSRTEQLARRNVATPTELLDARSTMAKVQAALDVARNDLLESEAMRRMSQQELDYTEIRAPIDGVVADCEVEVGEVAIAGTTNLPGAKLMTILDPDRMQVRADVDETDVPLVRPGQPARIYLQADLLTAIPGEVERVAPRGRLEAEVVTFETIIRDQGGPDSPLRPGMTATVEIEVRRAPDALSVPIQAVVQRRRKDLPDSPELLAWLDRHPPAPGEAIGELGARYVTTAFVAVDGKARARPVDVGLSDERRVEILAGLGPDDRVIVGPFRTLEELKDGDPITEADPETASETGTPP
ncbi:efflux RND transporter periplasmic adaptor subunit [Tautonia sociabilis]|uniref:Efflux RND transporter periplasmic adaptor subunit n=1 Tax=Tautonia sociabilis TaxID=2080755 RepID=A0A432MNJ5_9BACT|nr:efflux RND transporter periplasmic adaptor subunit [Tautonia sociabilis]RUL88982.1 efflux RND transporter periplasmic adaptor subunit [Tautonia sociabilis]